MPKPQKKPNGSYVLNVAFQSRRKKLTLGKVTRQDANLFCANLELLLDYRRRGSRLTNELTLFINTLCKDHLEKLTNLGVVYDNDRSITIGQLIKKFLENYKDREDIMESTKQRMDRALRRFPKWFQSMDVEDITPKKEIDRPNAEPTFSKDSKKTLKRVESHMRNHHAVSTWSRTHGNLREVGNWAVRVGYVDYNPFSLLPCPGERNPARNVYVETVWVEDAIDQCRDSDTRIAFAMGRYAGLRLHSELRTMKWEHIELDSDTPTLKTFDSKKREFREPMPVFPDLARHLLEHREESGNGKYVISNKNRRNTDNYLYKLMAEAVMRTEHQRWTRLRQNLRTSCENDLLSAGFPENLVVAWIGHTVKVSRESYQKVTKRQIAEAFSREVF